jgi:serine/threonine-protein kinase
MAFCSHCGTAVTAGSQYCAQCGSAVGDDSDAPTQQIRRPSDESIAVGERRLLTTLRQVTLGEYEVLGEIGRGGMAVVYAAHDIALDRKVAIKVMSPALTLMDAGVQSRFKREARTAASLSHPHVIPVYAVRESDDIVYFVMKYVAGRTLESVISDVGQMPIVMVQTILRQAGGALGYAHRKGVVHRDVKPANIMLDEEGWVVVTDFGIAKVSEAQALTVTGGVVGTPAYMSPEQCAGRDITGAADQYSLGVVAFEMLTGQQPFRGSTMVNLLYDHCHTPPPSILDLRQDCPPELADAAMRMLDKNPANRFPTVEDAVAAIGTVSDSQSGTARTEMLTLAQAGTPARLLDQHRTPGSPVPQDAPTTNYGAVAEWLAGESKRPRPAGPGSPAPAAPAATPPSRRRLRSALLALLVLGIPSVVIGWAVLGSSGDPEGAAAAVVPPLETTATPPIQVPTPAIATLTVAPGELSLRVGDTESIAAAAYDRDGSPIDSAKINWESADAGIAMVSESGIVTATGAGVTRIRARADTRAADVQVRVLAPTARNSPAPVPVSVDTVTLAPANANLIPGQTLRLQAAVLDGRARTLTGRPINWVSDNPGVATVDASGLVTGRAEGATRISATSEGRTSVTTLTVSPEPVARVTVDPDRWTMAVGDTAQLSVHVVGSGGAALDRPIEWESSNPSIASVSSDGVVRAVTPGSATVTARAGERMGRTSITVGSAAEPSPLEPTSEEIALQIETRLDAYRQALESEDIAAVQRAYPGLTAEQERSWRDFFGTAEDVRVTFTIQNRTLGDSVATVLVQARLMFRAAGQQDQASDFTATFERNGQDWILIRIE